QSVSEVHGVGGFRNTTLGVTRLQKPQKTFCCESLGPRLAEVFCVLPVVRAKLMGSVPRNLSRGGGQSWLVGCGRVATAAGRAGTVAHGAGTVGIHGARLPDIRPAGADRRNVAVGGNARQRMPRSADAGGARGTSAPTRAVRVALTREAVFRPTRADSDAER